MVRYFFHVIHDGDPIEDPEGAEFADLTAAENEALNAARQLWRAAILQQRDIGADRFEIADEYGNVLKSIGFDLALPPALRARLRLDP